LQFTILYITLLGTINKLQKIVDIQNVTYEKSYTNSEEEKVIKIAKKYDTSRQMFVYKAVKLKILLLSVLKYGRSEIL
jgi:hypothetical protein